MNKERLIEQIREAVHEAVSKVFQPFEIFDEVFFAKVAEQVRQGVIATYSKAGAKRLPVIIPKVIDSEEDRKDGKVRFSLEYRHPDTNEVMTEEEVKQLMRLDEFVALTLGLTPSVEEEQDEPMEENEGGSDGSEAGKEETDGRR